MTPQVQDLSADLTMRLDLVNGGLSIVVNLFLGSYSDVLGRRFVILVSLIGHFLRNATFPVIIYWDLGLPALYAGYVVDGLCGGSSGEWKGLRVGEVEREVKSMAPVIIYWYHRAGDTQPGPGFARAVAK